MIFLDFAGVCSSILQELGVNSETDKQDIIDVIQASHADGLSRGKFTELVKKALEQVQLHQEEEQ